MNIIYTLNLPSISIFPNTIMNIQFLLPKENANCITSNNLVQSPQESESENYHQVIPGQVISVESDYLRGHGTYSHVPLKDFDSDSDNDDNGECEENKQKYLIATVRGRVERVNKLISVIPQHSRYQPELGDVIVGRIKEVAKGRWLADINARSHASLLLSAINLPGGVQRKRTYLDELNMRSFFVEDDLFSAEVQQLMHDGTIQIHTRGEKFGKVGNGLLVTTDPSCIPRQKSHFYTFSCGVAMILGINGFIWLYDPRQGHKIDFFTSYENVHSKDDEEQQKRNDTKNIDHETRENIVRIGNLIQVLATQAQPITPQHLEIIFAASLSHTTLHSCLGGYQVLVGKNPASLVKELKIALKNLAKKKHKG